MSDPTVQFSPGGMPPRPIRSGEPMTQLVFDQELVGRLQALQQSGFSIRAEQVIAEHLVKVGQHRAGGRTPREIKEYIWQQMQWGDTGGGVPAAPDGDLHSLRRSVRANTEVMNPPESYQPYLPGQQAAGAPPQTPAGGPQDPEGPRGDGDGGGTGARVLGEILALVPRALLLLGVYQLVRLIPGFDRMPDVSLWEPFRAIGDGVLGLLNLNPDWSDQAANMTIPALGLVLAGLLNYVTPLRRGRRLHVWPYFLVIIAWSIVFAAGGIGGFLSDATQDVRQDIEQGVEDEVSEQVDRTVEDQRQQVEDQVSEQVGEQVDGATGAPGTSSGE